MVQKVFRSWLQVGRYQVAGEIGKAGERSSPAKSASPTTGRLSVATRSHRIASGSIPCARHHDAYTVGEISEGLISLRPPQNTLVYATGIPTASRCASIAALCASTIDLSVPCATAMMLT